MRLTEKGTRHRDVRIDSSDGSLRFFFFFGGGSVVGVFGSVQVLSASGHL